MAYNWGMETKAFERENGTEVELHWYLDNGRVTFDEDDIVEFGLTVNEVQDLPALRTQVEYDLAEDADFYATDLGAGNGAFL